MAVDKTQRERGDTEMKQVEDEELLFTSSSPDDKVFAPAASAEQLGLKRSTETYSTVNVVYEWKQCNNTDMSINVHNKHCLPWTVKKTVNVSQSSFVHHPCAHFGPLELFK